MYTHKYHVFLGMLCLIFSIILPTLIYQYYLLLKPWNNAILESSFYIQIIAYGLFSILVFFLFAFLMVALRELGGALMNIINSDKHDVERFGSASV